MEYKSEFYSANLDLFLGGKLLLFIIVSDIDFPGYYAYQMISKSFSLSVPHWGEIILKEKYLIALIVFMNISFWRFQIL